MRTLRASLVAMRMQHTFGVTCGLLVLAATVYACSSNNASSGGPPLNDSGATTDSSMTGDDSGGTTDGSGSSSGGGGDGSGSGSGGVTDGSMAGDGSMPACDGGAPPADAGPAPSCTSLPGKVVYVLSGDTQEPLLKALGRKLRDSANITLAYQLTGSCTLSPALYNNTPIPKNTNMFYIPSTAENPCWTTAQPESVCTTDANNGTPPDLGISALFPSSCAGLGAPPAGIGSFIGPIQAYTFIVPTAEFTGGQTSISAEEAYYAFGDGVNNPVTVGGNAEWNVPSQFFLRPASKSTLVATAKNIKLTPAQMTLVTGDGGTSDGRQLLATSAQVFSGVAASTSAQAIGILGDEIYDSKRGAGVDVLAFSAFGQNAAYYPDSTTSSFDKQNIRDGHYSLWSPTVYIAPVDGSGVPTNAAVKYITDLVLGNPTTGYNGGAPIDGIGTVTKVGLTPSCAMQVTRAGDGQPLTPSTPSSPCTCYFLSKIPGTGTLPASCVACSASSPCTTGTCSNGYCEVPPPAPTDCEGGVTSVLNACTTATAVTKAGVVYPTTDGGLLPPNP